MAYQDVRELLGNRPRKKLGEIGGPEIWWVERQQALERAGYMLRPRYRPDWTPSWAGTNKLPLNFEDGHRQLVSNGHPPTYISIIVLITCPFSGAFAWMLLESLTTGP